MHRELGVTEDMKKESTIVRKTYNQVKLLADDREEWKSFVDALCAWEG